MLAAPDLLLDVEATQIIAIHLGAILVGLAFVVLRATKQAQRAIADRQTEASRVRAFIDLPWLVRL